MSADHDGAPLSHAVAPTGPPGGGAPVHAVQIGFEDIHFGARGIGLPIVEAHCRHSAPLGLEDVVEVRLAPSDVTRRGFRIGFDMARRADCVRVAQGHVLRRFIDLASKEPMEIDDDLLRIFHAMTHESREES